jgi:hypothetical protein
MRSQTRDGRRGMLVPVVLSLVVGVFADQARGAAQAAASSHPAVPPIARTAEHAGAVVVTPVEGPSVLRHLGGRRRSIRSLVRYNPPQLNG